MKRLYFKILLAVIILFITAFYFFFNPAKSKLGYQCIFNKITGFYCFGCGGQRAFHALLHGHFQTAFQDNLLIFIVLPLVFLKIVEELVDRKLMPKLVYSRIFLSFMIIVISAFTILRNLEIENFPKLIP